MAEITDAKEGSTRWKLEQWIDSPRIRHSTLGLFALNTLTLGLSASDRVNDAVGSHFRFLLKSCFGVLWPR